MVFIVFVWSAYAPMHMRELSVKSLCGNDAFGFRTFHCWHKYDVPHMWLKITTGRTGDQVCYAWCRTFEFHMKSEIPHARVVTSRALLPSVCICCTDYTTCMSEQYLQYKTYKRSLFFSSLQQTTTVESLCITTVVLHYVCFEPWVNIRTRLALFLMSTSQRRLSSHIDNRSTE